MHRCHTIATHTSEMTSHVRVRSVLDESRIAAKHVRARARARFLRTHGHASTYCHAHSSGCPCDGACSARASRPSMFFRRGSKEKKHLRSFRWIFNMFHYISLSIIYGKSTFVIVNNLQEIIDILSFRVFHITWFVKLTDK